MQSLQEIGQMDDLIFPDENNKPEQVQDNSQTNDLSINFLEARIKDSGIELDAGQQAALAAYSSKMMSAVHAASVMTCASDCPMLHACYLHNSGIKLPVGKLCPIELAIMDDCISRNVAGLDIDLDSAAGQMELLQVWELARAEVVEWKAGAKMADRKDVIMRELTSAVPDMNGNVTNIFEEKITPEVQLMERWAKMKLKMREALLATRKAQAAAGQVNDDETNRLTTLKKRAERVKQMKKERKSIEISND